MHDMNGDELLTFHSLSSEDQDKIRLSRTLGTSHIGIVSNQARDLFDRVQEREGKEKQYLSGTSEKGEDTSSSFFSWGGSKDDNSTSLLGSTARKALLIAMAAAGYYVAYIGVTEVIPNTFKEWRKSSADTAVYSAPINWENDKKAPKSKARPSNKHPRP